MRLLAPESAGKRVYERPRSLALSAARKQRYPGPNKANNFVQMCHPTDATHLTFLYSYR